ncbi:expressed unknown protein [Seminavis robusta]|uniref:DUF6824 domain-containing protein n=1 Tax=Seminavis robusta TaxID=568900 RepID=A0A9N8E1Z6_9STRA|nr:expressed unknown protein [Seminavis robusta]|eukprot:Sro449_g145400.1 n/a (791) ;mRNA; f:57670-60254
MNMNMNQQQQQQQQYGGYAYYAPPQYNYNAHVAYNGQPTSTGAQQANVNHQNNNGNVMSGFQGFAGMMGFGTMAAPGMEQQPQQQQQHVPQGAPITNPMMDMMQQQQHPQAAPGPAYEIIEPGDTDVLMGRGGKNNQHVGNERLRDMARAIRDKYKASSKKGKSNLSRDLVQQVRDLPGRFLKRNPVTNEWEDVGDEIAREKVSQVLRDAVSEWTGPKAAAAAAKKEDEEKQRAQAIALAKLEREEEEAEEKAKAAAAAKNKPKADKTTKTAAKEKKSSLASINLPPPPSEIPPANKTPAPMAPPAVPKKVAPVSQFTTAPAPIAHVVTQPIADEPIIPPDLALTDDFDDFPPGPEMSDESFPAMPDESLTGGGRDRFLSDMSFNDPTAILESPTNNTLENNNDDDGDRKPRARLDSDDSTEAAAPSRRRPRLGTDDSTDDLAVVDPTNQDAAAAANNDQHKHRGSHKVPVATVPWNRNKRKTNLLDRYACMGISSSDMSITSMGSQLSSRSLMGSQLSSRQLMSSGTRQMSSRQLSQRQLSQRQLSSRQLSSRQLSSRQLSSRQLSSRQLSNRQLSSRQLSGRHLMSVEQRKSKFAMMGESDLSLDALSITDDMTPTNGRSPSRKNIFMEQYMAMDMGLSDFSLGSTMATEPMEGFHRPGIIIEGIDEELSEYGGSSHHMKLSKHGGSSRFPEAYDSAGVGTSMSNMTINTIGTFSGHSRRGLFAGTGNSMRMESGHSFMTMTDLQLEMLDDELFDEFASDDIGGADEFGGSLDEEDEFGGEEFSTEFC